MSGPAFDPDMGPPLCLCCEERPAEVTEIVNGAEGILEIDYLCDSDLGSVCAECARDLGLATAALANVAGILGCATETNR